MSISFGLNQAMVKAIKGKPSIMSSAWIQITTSGEVAQFDQELMNKSAIEGCAYARAFRAFHKFNDAAAKLSRAEFMSEVERLSGGITQSIRALVAVEPHSRSWHAVMDELKDAQAQLSNVYVDEPIALNQLPGGYSTPRQLESMGFTKFDWNGKRVYGYVSVNEPTLLHKAEEFSQAVDLVARLNRAV